MSELRDHWERLPRPVRGTIIFAAGAATAIVAVLGPKSQPTEPRTEGPAQDASLSVGVVCDPFESKVDASTSGNRTLISCTSPDGNLAKVGIMTALSPNNTDPSQLSGIIQIAEKGRKHTFDCVGKMGRVTMRPWDGSVVNEENSNRIDGVGCVQVDAYSS